MLVLLPKISPASALTLAWLPAAANAQIQSGSYFGRLDRPNDIDRVVGFFTIASPMEAQIAEQIEWLEKQLDDLLQGKELTSQSESAPKAVPRVSSAKRPVSSAPQSGKAERGTLRPAVVEILKKNGLSRLPTFMTRL